MNTHWETVDGRRLYRAEVSDHHFQWPRREQKTPLQKKFRQMGGMVAKLANQPHRDLHSNVSPPPIVNPNLMQDIYLHARRTGYEDVYDLFYQIVEYVGGVASSFQCQQNVEDAALLHANFLQQAEFVEQGRLTLVKAVA